MRKAQTGEYSPQKRGKRGRFVQSETPRTATTVSRSEPETPPESRKKPEKTQAYPSALLNLRNKVAWGKEKLREYWYVIVALAVIIITSYLVVFRDLPSPNTLRQADAFASSTRIFDRNEKLLFEIYTERNRTPVKLKELPEYVKQAHIAIEDKNFYHHHGFASEGLLRATINTLFRRKLQGGSTITQQLVKTALLSPERTIQRKIREAILTILTELIYPK